MVNKRYRARQRDASGSLALVSFLNAVPKSFFSIVMFSAVIIWCLPLFGLIINSFRSFTDVTGSGWWTIVNNPEFTLDNYKVALSYGQLFSGFLNSLLITIPSTFFLVAFATAAAFALIWTDLPWRGFIYTAIVAMIVIPPEITLYPTLVILRTINLVNTFPGIWMSHASAAMPFGVFLIGSFISQIPRELIEAAKVDGAKTWHLLFRIILPLSGSAILSLATFDFLWVWNDLLRALVIIPDPTIRPLTAVLANISGGYGEYITVIAAGATMLMLPPLLVFLLAQRAFIRGVLAGAVK